MVKKYILFFWISLAVLKINTVYAQTTKTPKTTSVTPSKKYKEPTFTRWSLKAGANLSVIYLARNIKEKNNEPGYCGGLTYEANDFVRISTLYSRFQPTNIEPTWLNVKASTIEANLEILAKFPNKKTLLYPFVGFSYNTYQGFFTGESDYLGLREYYPVNSIVKNNWFGVNFGTGLEHNFGILGLYVDYRMRVGKEEEAINIMDVCYTAGLKVTFPYGKFAKRIANPNDRFHWF
jgi:hypothetical protein